MSPHARCRKCDQMRVFHEDELKGVHEGKVFCTDCTLDRGYDEFLGEVLAGEHPKLIEMLKERLEEDEL